MTSPAAESLKPIDYARTLAFLPDFWLTVARNLIPVIGVGLFGWSAELTAFNYWFDGVSSLGAMIGVVLASGIAASGRRPNAPPAVFAMLWLMLMGIVFGTCAIPYWLLLNSHLGVLNLDAVGLQFAQRPGLWLTFSALVVSHFWNAVRAGYAGMENDRLKRRFSNQFWTLLIRAGAMFAISHLGSTALLVPMMALVLIVLETRPMIDAFTTTPTGALRDGYTPRLP